MSHKYPITFFKNICKSTLFVLVVTKLTKHNHSITWVHNMHGGLIDILYNKNMVTMSTL